MANNNLYTTQEASNLALVFDASGAVVAPGASSVSTTNSSTTPLAANGVFTGAWEAVANYSVIEVTAISNVASATDGFTIQQSTDGTNIDVTDSYTATAASGKTISLSPAASFYRIVYTNGGTIQASFRLQTVYHRGFVKPSSQRASDAMTNESDLEQQLSYQAIFNGTTWDRQRSSGVLGIPGQSLVASPSGGYSYNHISTSTTTVVKSGAGSLHSICVNTKGTVASTITIYDNTSAVAPVVAVIDSLNLSGTFILDIAFATGLTIVTTGTVAPDITVSYK